MTVKEIHGEIKEMISESGVIQVSHSYRNDVVGEVWEAIVYEKAENTIDSYEYVMLMVHLANSVDELMESVKDQYEKYKPDTAGKIAKLKRQLAELEGL
jgi:hypothetical protein